MAGEDALAAIAKQFNVSPEQAAALAGVGGGGVNNPFASTESPMSLWRGKKQNPGTYSVPWSPTGPYKPQPHSVMYNGVRVDVMLPALPDGYKIEIHAGIAAGDVKNKATADTPLFFEVKDKQGKVVERYNIDDPQQKAVIFGKQPVMKAPGSADVTLEPDMERFRHGGGETDDTGTIEQELKQLYSEDPNNIRKYKLQMWLSGYYGTSTPLAKVNMETITNDDIANFTNVMLQAARYYSAGKNIRWQDLLVQQASSPSAGSGQQVTTVMTDPEAITLEADAAATKILGREASPTDVQTLIKLIHGKESAIGTAQESDAQTATGVDPAAQIEQYFREKYPNEALAVDYGSRAQQWEQMLATTSPQPQVIPLG